MTTYVLVHGAWHGGWCWCRVLTCLHSESREVQGFAPTLTGLGDRFHLASPEIDLSVHVRDVLSVIEDHNLHDVILVGHSYAGMVITTVAERVPERLAQLVYLDAFVPLDGQSLADIIGPALTQDILRQAHSGGRGWLVPPLPPEDFGVSDEDDVRWMKERLVAHPLRTIFEPVRLGNAAAALPRAFIYCNKPELGLFKPFAERAKTQGWQYNELGTGHDAMITQPQQLAALLLEIGR